jgi:protein gp37
VYNPGTSAVTIAGIVIPAGDIQTVAGNGTACTAATLAGCGDGGLATSADLNYPQGVFVDTSGDIFIADTANSVVREVVAATGDIQTVAGNGTAGYSGDTGPATQAELSDPYGVFVDIAGNIFIADTDNNVIREVAASSGIITTVAGNGTDCSPSTLPCGDGSAATSAQLSSPAGVFVDLSEDIFIADTFDHRIREVTASTGIINTVVGTGAEGYAGDGAAAASAELDTPYGVWVDTSGDIFIADTDNAAIREVVAATGFIQTVAGIPATAAGTPTPGFSGDGGLATSAELNSPQGVFGSSSGNLFVADSDNSRIRELVQSIFVTVAPSSATVVVNALQQFTATVTGTSNTNVNWLVNGVSGGNSTVGTISTTGLFQAPATIPSPATVTITAISQADNTTSGLAQATIVGVGGAVNVAVTTSPAVTEVYTSTTQTFMATVTGTTNMAVTWQVNGTPGGNAMVGTIDTSGNYTGPAAVPTPNPSVVIEAVSQALSSAIGAESVMIVTNPSAAQPAPQTSSPGGQATYSLLLNENTGDPKYAITLSCLQSSLPPNATCGFTPSTITPGPIAVSFTLTITVPSGSASLEKRNGMRPQLYFAFLAFAPLAGILFAGVGLRNKRRRWLWLAGLCVFLILLNACGGSSSPGSTNPELGTYNVKVQGTTTAQPNPVTITIAGLTVQ